MTIDRMKLALWIALFAALGAGYLFLHEKPAPRPEPPAIHVELPPSPAPVVVTVPVASPVAAKPAVKKPVAAPLPPVQKTPAVKPKPLKKKPADPCAKVPAKAYLFPKDMVMKAAADRGLSPVHLAQLGVCIDRHAAG